MIMVLCRLNLLDGHVNIAYNTAVYGYNHYTSEPQTITTHIRPQEITVTDAQVTWIARVG